MNSPFDLQSAAQFEAVSRRNDAAAFASDALCNVSLGARSTLVNRTHRVVRERAAVLQTQRNRARSLMLPLAICSILLVLTCFALWTGLYQYQATESVQADVAGLSASDVNNHFLVVLLWFVPVSLTLMAALWLRHTRRSSERETR